MIWSEHLLPQKLLFQPVGKTVISNGPAILFLFFFVLPFLLFTLLRRLVEMDIALATALHVELDFIFSYSAKSGTMEFPNKKGLCTYPSVIVFIGRIADSKFRNHFVVMNGFFGWRDVRRPDISRTAALKKGKRVFRQNWRNEEMAVSRYWDCTYTSGVGAVSLVSDGALADDGGVRIPIKSGQQRRLLGGCRQTTVGTYGVSSLPIFPWPELMDC